MKNERSEIIKYLIHKIEEICLICPDLRLGQILQTLLSESENNKDLYYVEDYEWIEFMNKIAKKEICADYSGYIH